MWKVTLWPAAPCRDPLQIHADSFSGHYGVEPGAAHQDENLSDQPLRFIRIELKLAVGATDQKRD